MRRQPQQNPLPGKTPIVVTAEMLQRSPNARVLGLFFNRGIDPDAPDLIDFLRVLIKGGFDRYDRRDKSDPEYHPEYPVAITFAHESSTSQGADGSFCRDITLSDIRVTFPSASKWKCITIPGTATARFLSTSAGTKLVQIEPSNSLVSLLMLTDREIKLNPSLINEASLVERNRTPSDASLVVKPEDLQEKFSKMPDFDLVLSRALRSDAWIVKHRNVKNALGASVTEVLKNNKGSNKDFEVFGKYPATESKLKRALPKDTKLRKEGQLLVRFTQEFKDFLKDLLEGGISKVLKEEGVSEDLTNIEFSSQSRVYQEGDHLCHETIFWNIKVTSQLSGSEIFHTTKIPGTARALFRRASGDSSKFELVQTEVSNAQLRSFMFSDHGIEINKKVMEDAKSEEQLDAAGIDSLNVYRFQYLSRSEMLKDFPMPGDGPEHICKVIDKRQQSNEYVRRNWELAGVSKDEVGEYEKYEEDKDREDLTVEHVKAFLLDLPEEYTKRYGTECIEDWIWANISEGGDLYARFTSLGVSRQASIVLKDLGDCSPGEDTFRLIVDYDEQIGLFIDYSHFFKLQPMSGAPALEVKGMRPKLSVRLTPSFDAKDKLAAELKGHLAFSLTPDVVRRTQLSGLMGQVGWQHDAVIEENFKATFEAQAEKKSRYKKR